MVITHKFCKEPMFLTAPLAKVFLDVTLPHQGLFVRFGHIQVYLFLPVYAGSDITAAVKIYTHAIDNILNIGTPHLDHDILFVLLVGKHDIVNCNIGHFVALYRLRLYRQCTAIVGQITEQLYLECHCNRIGIAYKILGKIYTTVKIGSILIVKICTVRTLVKEVGFVLLASCKSCDKAQQQNYIIISPFHIIVYQINTKLLELCHRRYLHCQGYRQHHRSPHLQSSHTRPRHREAGR